MGQGQSADDADQLDSAQLKQDYYELLGVERTASEDEIKKAYRRKALELHPDRNFGKVEDATTLFAEVQSAYEVLSDPQERAWYDSHRDVLLRGDQGKDGQREEYSYNIRMTTADEVLQFMLKFNGRLDFSDSPSGFYGGLHDLFSKLAREEQIACQWEGTEGIDYPDFGHKDDSYEDVVRPFYAAWNGFASRKSFAWKDHYRLSDAPDRRVRRLMERENKRIREDAVREYNDAVRSLIAFVRKRDPRYQENQKSEAERQKMLREAAAAHAARSRAARQARLEELDKAAVPDWAKSERKDEHEGGFSSSEESEEHEFECVVCDKSFKSEAQFHAHEKSKKHVKLLKQLKREMREEGKDLDLDEKEKEKAEDNGQVHAEAVAREPDINATEEPEETGEAENAERTEAARESEGEPEQDAIASTNGHAAPKASPIDASTGDEDADSDYAPRSAVEERLTSDKPDDLSARLKATVPNDTPGTSDTDMPKLGKAKLKRAKKAAQQRAGVAKDGDDEFRCAVCQSGFPSKTRLFNHIKDQGHAAPVAQMKEKGGRGKRK